MAESKEKNGTYTYNPENVSEFGMDRMRFELGDVMVDGGSATSALTDAEINAALTAYPKSWKRAKLMLLESLFRRFSYEVDMRTGPLTLSLGERAKQWKKDYDDLKKEIDAESALSAFKDKSPKKPPYFHTGMQENERVWGNDKRKVHVP